MNPFVILDFEYRGGETDRPEPVCLVAMELGSGREYRVWLEGEEPSGPPFPLREDTVLVAHAISPAECRCWRARGWPEPAGWLDTRTECLVLARGAEKPPDGYSLLGCCRRLGIPAMSEDEKKVNRDLVQRGNYSDGERDAILEYCAADVRETTELFRRILPALNLPQALWRGRYLAEASRIGDRGLPVDVARLERLRGLGNTGLRRLAIEHLDPHGLHEGTVFKMAKFSALVRQSGIPWPTTPGGQYRTDKDTLGDMSRLYGEPWDGVHELLKTTRQSSVDGLVLRADGRLHADPWPLDTITGRCAPSTTEFLWGGPKWRRSLLRAPPGRSILYVDWSNQEYAIAAALSQEPAMVRAYKSGDPYIELGKLAGRLPSNATKQSHPKERAAFKVVSLGVLMGMGARTVGRQTGVGFHGGRELLDLHRRTFQKFWRWSDGVADTGAAAQDIETAFGLIYNPASSKDFKPLTARNFPLQATGSDMLRNAVLLLAEAGVEVIATVHDAVLVECDTATADQIARTVERLMEEASRLTLWDRLTVRAEAARFDHPLHYQDEKGVVFWRRLATLLGLELDRNEG